MSTKKRAATKNSSKTAKRSNRRMPLYASLKESLSWRQLNPNSALVDAIIDHLEKWLKDETNTDIYAFFHYLGMPSTTYYEWVNKYPKMKHAHNTAMEILGVRRQEHAEYRKHNTNPEVIRLTLHKYHPLWKEVAHEEKAFKKELKHDLEEQQRPVNIYMDGVKVEDKNKDE